MGCLMACAQCGSNNQGEFPAEINLHFPGMANLRRPTVWVFPNVVLCFDCGHAEFTVPEGEVRALANGAAA